jgi:type I restriction enzyme S subunit
MTWRKVQFKEIVEFPPKVKLETGEEYDFIPMDQVDGGVKYVQDIDRKTYTGGGAKFSNGDTIFARITPCLENGKIAKVKNLEKGIGFGSTEFFVFRAIEGASDPDFIYYLAKSETIRQPAIKSMVGASGRQRADKGVVEEIVIPVPPLPTQRRIASILSTYDDLIENNLKRIKLLEEAAQNIYREWFVHFRFPGHERVRRGADGLPEGWRRVQFSEVVQISPPTPIVKDEPAPYVPMASLSESMMIITDVERRIPSGGARFKNGDTLFARITPCLENGKTAFVQFLDGEQTATGSTEFIVFRETSSVNQFFIYCVSREYSFRQHAIKSMTGSDGRQRVKPEAFDSYFIAVPPTVVMDQFFTVAAPLFKQVQVLVNSNARLKEARDILLPRLMNQTIEV